MNSHWIHGAKLWVFSTFQVNALTLHSNIERKSLGRLIRAKILLSRIFCLKHLVVQSYCLTARYLALEGLGIEKKDLI